MLVRSRTACRGSAWAGFAGGFQVYGWWLWARGLITGSCLCEVDMRCFGRLLFSLMEDRDTEVDYEAVGLGFCSTGDFWIDRSRHRRL